MSDKTMNLSIYKLFALAHNLSLSKDLITSDEKIIKSYLSIKHKPYSCSQVIYSVILDKMYFQLDKEDVCLQLKHPLPFRAQIAFCDL